MMRTSPRKQVDATWLHRRKHCGPSPADREPVDTPDPDVRLRCAFSGAGGAAGVTAGHDPATLLPRFSLACNLDRAFGQDENEWAERAALQTALALDLVGPSL
jgi:hypothetical protein